MKINLNGVRKSAAYSLDRLIKKLNAGMLSDYESVLEGGEWVRGDVLVDSNDIKKDIAELRNVIWTLLCCYDENNPLFAEVWQEVGDIARFPEVEMGEGERDE
jgi:hypothetical protein